MYNVNKNNKPWYYDECKRARADYVRVKNKLRKIKHVKTDAVKSEYVNKAKDYKRLIKKTSKAYLENLHKSLHNLRSCNPKAYLNILNKGSKGYSKVGNIALNTFLNHFKKLSQKGNEHEEHGILDSTANFDPRTITHSINEELNKPVSYKKFVKLLVNLKGTKHVVWII